MCGWEDDPIEEIFSEEDMDIDPEFWCVGEPERWVFGFRCNDAKRASVCNGKSACIVSWSILPWDRSISWVAYPLNIRQDLIPKESPHVHNPRQQLVLFYVNELCIECDHSGSNQLGSVIFESRKGF